MSNRVELWIAGRTATVLLAFTAFVLVTGTALEAQSSGTSEAPVKVAVVDVERVFVESPVIKESREILRDLQERKKSELEVMRQAIQVLKDRLSEGGLSLSEEKLSELRLELEQKEIEFRRFEDDANRELQQGQEKALRDFQRQVMPVIAEVGRDLGYTAIFNKFQSGLLYAPDEADITNLILQRFDQRGEQGN